MNLAFPKISKYVLILSLLCCLAPVIAYALPEGESVVPASGTASFDRTQTNTLNITTSDTVIINYNSFNIAAQETVNFIQPSSSSIALNRVVGGDPSSIMGSLTATGRIFLINPNGVIFGAGSHVDVAGLVASTLDIADEDFLSGNYRFSKTGSKAGSIINQGSLIARPGGYICLLSQAVDNQTLIQAETGSIVLAAGEKMTLGLDGENGISVVIDDAVSAEVFGPSGKMNSAVKNSGTISANGGKVLINARILNKVFDYAINNTGTIEATYLQEHDGVVELVAEGAPVYNIGKIEAGTVEVEVLNSDFANLGQVLADGTEAQYNGGYINITALNVLQQGVISANAFVYDGEGPSAGQGGHGGQIDIVAQDTVTLDSNSTTEARAAGYWGNGGRIMISSEGGNTVINRNAKIDVSGGMYDPGFINISAFEQLGFYGILNGRAPPGYYNGLFSAKYVLISGEINANLTVTALADITIAGDITLSQGVYLQLLADHKNPEEWDNGSGSILNPGHYLISNDLEANDTYLFLAASSGIGSGAYPLNINVYNLSLATNPVVASTSIYIIQGALDLVIGDFNAPGATIFLEAYGAISGDDAYSVNITAKDLFISARGGIGATILKVSVSSLFAENDLEGNIQIYSFSSNPLNILGIENRSASGYVEIRSLADICVIYSILSNGDIQLVSEANIYLNYYADIIAYNSGASIYLTAVSGQIARKGLSVPGLYGYWSFDEVYGGVVYDLSGNGNNGTVYGNPYLQSGVFGQAMYFDGIDDYIRVIGDLNLGTGSFTIMLWYKGTQDRTYIGLAGATSGYTPGYVMENFSGHLRSWINEGVYDSSQTINDGVWHQLVMVRDGAFGRLYIDGVAATDYYAVSTDSVNSGRDFWIGGWGYLGRLTQGLIDEVRVFNTALSPWQVSAEHFRGSGVVSADNVVLNAGCGIDLHLAAKTLTAQNLYSGNIYLTNNADLHALSVSNFAEGGDVTLDIDGDLTVNSVSGDEVSLYAAGSINGQGGSLDEPNIAARSLLLDAGYNIGKDDFDGEIDNTLYTDAEELYAYAGGDIGVIISPQDSEEGDFDPGIYNTGDLYLADIYANSAAIAAEGDLSVGWIGAYEAVGLEAFGSIYGRDGSLYYPNIIAPILYLNAGGDIGRDSESANILFTEVARLYAYTLGDIGFIGDGYVDPGIYNLGDLSIIDIEAGRQVDGEYVVGGNVIIQAQGDITVGSLTGPYDYYGQAKLPAQAVFLLASGSIYGQDGNIEQPNIITPFLYLSAGWDIGKYASVYIQVEELYAFAGNDIGNGYQEPGIYNLGDLVLTEVDAYNASVKAYGDLYVGSVIAGYQAVLDATGSIYGQYGDSENPNVIAPVLYLNAGDDIGRDDDFDSTLYTQVSELFAYAGGNIGRIIGDGYPDEAGIRNNGSLWIWDIQVGYNDEYGCAVIFADGDLTIGEIDADYVSLQATGSFFDDLDESTAISANYINLYASGDIGHFFGDDFIGMIDIILGVEGYLYAKGENIFISEHGIQDLYVSSYELDARGQIGLVNLTSEGNLVVDQGFFGENPGILFGALRDILIYESIQGFGQIKFYADIDQNGSGAVNQYGESSIGAGYEQLFVYAAEGINLAYTRVSQLEAVNTSSGNIDIINMLDLFAALVTNDAPEGEVNLSVGSEGCDLSVGFISADKVNLSASGAIIDGNGTEDNISARELVLSASYGIGSEDALETAVSVLEATNSYSGDININNTGDMEVILAVNSADTGAVNLSAASDLVIGFISAYSVSLAASGSIIDGNGDSDNISALYLNISAVNGIGSGDALETEVSSLEATNSGSGDINIFNTGDLNVIYLFNYALYGEIDLAVDYDGRADLWIGQINAYRVNLSATGSIYGQGGSVSEPNINAVSLSLYSQDNIGRDEDNDNTLYTQVEELYAYADGDIGSLGDGYPDDPGIINYGNLSVLDLQAGGDSDYGCAVIYVEGDLTVGSVVSGFVNLSATGSIYGQNGDIDNPNIIASSLYISAGNNIGFGSTLFTRIEDLVAYAGGNIGFDETGYFYPGISNSGDLNLREVEAKSVAISADGDMYVNSVIADDTVGLEASGSINGEYTGQSREQVNITVPLLYLFAGMDIGSWNTLYTQVNELYAYAGGDIGYIYDGVFPGVSNNQDLILAQVQANNVVIETEGDLYLGEVNAGYEEGLVSLTATGAIIDANGAGNNVTAQSLRLFAANGIGWNNILETAVGNLAARNTAYGDINISNNGDLDISGDGIYNVNGNVNIFSNADLNVYSDIIAQNSIGLFAGADLYIGGVTLMAYNHVFSGANDFILSEYAGYPGEYLTLYLGGDSFAMLGTPDGSLILSLTVTSILDGGVISVDSLLIRSNAIGLYSSGDIYLNADLSAENITLFADYDHNGTGSFYSLVQEYPLNLIAYNHIIAGAGDFNLAYDIISCGNDFLARLSAPSEGALGFLQIESTSGNITISGAVQRSGTAGINLVARGAIIGADLQDPAEYHLISEADVFLTAYDVIASLLNPLRVKLSAGEVSVAIYGLKDGLSGVLAGSTPSGTIFVVNTPPGHVYFNGISVYSAGQSSIAEGINGYILGQLVQRPASFNADLSAYRVNTLSGPVFFYHPLTETEMGAFQELVLKAQDYNIHDGELSFTGNAGLLRFFEEFDNKKNKTPVY